MPNSARHPFDWEYLFERGYRVAERRLAAVAGGVSDAQFEAACVAGNEEIARLIAGEGARLGAELGERGIANSSHAHQLADQAQRNAERARCELRLELEAYRLRRTQAGAGGGAADKEQLKTAKTPKRNRRGRKPETDPKADKQVAAAWGTGKYKTYAELDRERAAPEGDSKRAIDRHRKRQ